MCLLLLSRERKLSLIKSSLVSYLTSFRNAFTSPNSRKEALAYLITEQDNLHSLFKMARDNESIPKVCIRYGAVALRKIFLDGVGE